MVPTPSRLSTSASFKGHLDRRHRLRKSRDTPVEQSSKMAPHCDMISTTAQEQFDHLYDTEIEPAEEDIDLIHAFPPTAQPRSRRGLVTTDKDGAFQFLAFASLKYPPSQSQLGGHDEEEQLHAGMSSAAACMTLELPNPSNGRYIQQFVKNPEFLSKTNSREEDKRITRSNSDSALVSAHEMESWRKSNSPACHRFKPIFTHQFFPDEHVRGYRPTDEALEEAMSVVRVGTGLVGADVERGFHSSFSHHNSANHSLAIQVRLAPSCKKCYVVLTVNRVGGDGKAEGLRTTGKAAASRNLADEFSSCDEDGREAGIEKLQQKNQSSRKRNRRILINTPKIGGCGFDRGEQKPVRKSARIRLSATHSQRNHCNTTSDYSGGRVFKLSQSNGMKTRSFRRFDENNENEAPDRNIGVRRSRRTCVLTQQSNQKLYMKNNESDDDLYFRVGSTNPRPTQSNNFIRRNRSRRVKLRRRAKRSLYTIDESADESGSFSTKANEVQKGGVSGLRSCTPISSKYSYSCSSAESSYNTDDDGSSYRSPNHFSQKCRRSGSQTSLSSSSSIDSTLDVQRMKVEAIFQHICSGLPEVATVIALEGDSCRVFSADDRILPIPAAVKLIRGVDNDYLDRPIGDVVREYSRAKTCMGILSSGGIESPSPTVSTGDFVLCIADMRVDQSARDYHDEVEKMAPWFIEVADCVEMGSFNGVRRGGHWKVLYLFERHQKSDDCSCLRPRRRLRSSEIHQYQLAGYMTLFYSSRRSEGTRMVICQALLLPPYQKHGHGREMMQAAYDIAHGIFNPYTDQTLRSREVITEIDVECPAPAFIALRNQIDFDLFQTIIADSQYNHLVPSQFTRPPQLAPGSELLEPKNFHALPRKVVAKLAKTLKISDRQVEIVYEIWKLHELEKSIKTIVNSSLSTAKVTKLVWSMESSYKCMVKTSLLQYLKGNDEDLRFGSLDTEVKMEFLEKSFIRNLAYFRSIVRKL